MQAFKTIAESTYQTQRSDAIERIKLSTAHVCNASSLYLHTEGTIHVYELDTATQTGALTIRDRDQEFTEVYPTVHALALLYKGSLLMARGCTKPQEPNLSAALAFWNVRKSGRVMEKVRDVPIHSPHNGAIAAWAWCEHEHTFTVAVAFQDIHCSITLYTFRRSELRPSKPATHTVQASKDANGAAAITNLHLLRSDSDLHATQLFVTLTQQDGPGRIEVRALDGRSGGSGGGAVATLEAAAVPPGRSALYGASSVVAVTAAEQTGPLASTRTQSTMPLAQVNCTPA